MFDLNDLKSFVDLGASFIFSCLLLWIMFKKLDGIETSLTKVLTLLTVIVKESTNFNHTYKVLGDQKTEVKDTLQSAGVK